MVRSTTTCVVVGVGVLVAMWGCVAVVLCATQGVDSSCVAQHRGVVTCRDTYSTPHGDVDYVARLQVRVGAVDPEPWLAPELKLSLRNAKPDPPSDVWSFGVVRLLVWWWMRAGWESNTAVDSRCRVCTAAG